MSLRVFCAYKAGKLTTRRLHLSPASAGLFFSALDSAKLGNMESPAADGAGAGLSTGGSPRRA